MRRILLLVGLVLAGVVVIMGGAALAGSVAGWTEGQPAANTNRVLNGLDEPAAVDLPKALAKRIEGPTFLVYFSPTCPHCQQAQPELNATAAALDGTAAFIGIASGAASDARARRFKRDYEVRYPIIHDADRSIAAALGARSTPSVLLVEPRKRTLVAVNAWYPFRSGTGPLLQMAVASDDPFAVFTEDVYQGNDVCFGCHSQEASSWMLSHHSIAWETLQQSEADSKPECVGCHVTGHGAATGWTAERAHLVDVGCEACHGPGGPHDGKRTAATETCAGCHDDKHSIAFSVAKGLPHIDHFRSVPLDDAAFREAWRDLHAGRAERPLLAFAEGPHVGSETCATCHESAHTWWKGDPHGRAMASLEGEAHHGTPATETVACVKCHASPKVYGGPTPTTLQGFVTREGGVGCESCHGPGGAHVRSGGDPDSIEGLGEDCPVCVLEALCTSCHTKAWDPAWDLETRLGAIGHDLDAPASDAPAP